MTLKVGVIWVNGQRSGGGFQQSLSTILALASASERHHNFVVLTQLPENLKVLSDYGVRAEALSYGGLSKLVDMLILTPTGTAITWQAKTRFRLSLDRGFDRILLKHRIDVAYFLEPSGLSSLLSNTPYITTVWDLCHRDFSEFPEVGWNRTFEWRELISEKALVKAIAVMTSSPWLAERISLDYRVHRERIHVLPLLPSPYVLRSAQCATLGEPDVRAKYGLETDYIFYPAQFWAHKNHVYILEALSLLKKQHGLRLAAVFAGADRGNLRHVQRKAAEMRLDEQVHFLGFVPDEDVPALYRRALALVMPTYFGPTNIPPLEACALGCPIIYSDLPGFREELKDAALYCDLASPASLAEQLQTLARSTPLAKDLARRGRLLLKDDIRARYVETIYSILDEYEYKSRRWR